MKTRDKVIDELAEALTAYPWYGMTKENKDAWRATIKDKILSNEHIAIVDRGAELPLNAYDVIKMALSGTISEIKISLYTAREVYEADFVKEIKDAPDTN